MDINMAASSQVITLTAPTLHCYLEEYQRLYSSDSSQEHSWLYTTSLALYYTYPVILTLSLIAATLSMIASSRMATESHHCYLAAFNACSTVLLLIVAVSQLTTYAGSSVSDSSVYRTLLPHLSSLQSWFWYATTWTLATAALERGLGNLSDGQAGSGRCCYGCGRVHGTLVSALVVFVSFVNALPQFWEYEAVSATIFTESSAGENCTVTGLQSSLALAYTGEYYGYHWYATVISTILPYILLPMLLPAIVCARGYRYTSVTSVSSRSPALKYHQGEPMSGHKEEMEDEREFDRLLAGLLGLYLLLGAPYTAMRLTGEDHVGLTVLEDDPQLRVTLMGLFETLYWFVFLMAFFMQLIVSGGFRKALSRLCSCKKEPQQYFY